MQGKIEELCSLLRIELHEQELDARCLMEHAVFQGEQAFPNQHGEMKANIMLAVRHIEDARMHLGKVCQYADDGTSIYDKPENE